jgi:tRNA threonylcarbamoyladenosine biosynthesis protein TsaE
MELGLEDYLYGRGVCVVEWAEKGFSVLPQEHLLIELDYLSEEERHLGFKPQGERYLSLLSALCNWQ